MPSRSRVIKRPQRVRQYAAAKVNRLTGNWVPVAQTVNELIASSAPQVRERVRQLVRDFPFFTRAVDVLVDTTVGTGIEFQSRVRIPGSRKYNYPVVNAIEEAFSRWCEEADCAGRLHFHELTRLSDRNDLEAGEHLFVRRFLKDSSRYLPLAIQAVEPDRLTSHGVKPLAGNEVEQGVEYDPDTGRAIAYHLQDNGYRQSVRRILAADVTHGFKPLRPDQFRGISPFASAVLVARDLDQFLGATIDTAKLASKYLAMVETADPAGFQMSRVMEDPASGQKIEELENAIIEYLRPGEKITFANHQVPNGQFDPFTRFILRMVAVATGTSYELLSGDYSGLSFSNLKAIRSDMVRGIKPRAVRRIRHFCKPVFRWFLQDASLHGRLRLPGLLGDPWRFERCVWVWPGMESPDRLRDTKADIEEINNGLRSPQEVAAARGRDLEEILDEIEEAREMREARKIFVTSEIQNMKNNPAALGADEGDRKGRVIPMAKPSERRTRGENDPQLTTRSTTLAPSSLKKEERSIEAVMASEAPTNVYSWEHGLVREVLLMDGATWPGSGQVPLLDTHDRYSSRSVLGSVSGIRAEKNQLLGMVRFSSTADDIMTKVEEGHLTDFSVGYSAIKSIFVEEGKTKTIKGREFAGPLLVTTKWRVKELSICPIGADENAKARAEADHIRNNNATEEEVMNKELLEMLKARGLAPDATEEQARAFLQKLLTDGDAETKRALETAQGEAVRLERDRATEIMSLGTRFEMSEQAAKAVQDGVTLDQFRQAVLKEFETRQAQQQTPSFRVDMGATDKEKFRSAATDSIIMRGGLSLEKPAVGAEDLMGYSLREIARELLTRSGERIPANPMEMIGRSLTTSDFPLILANVANKYLFDGYETAEETWRTWCGIGQTNDFKTLHIVRPSETDDLDEIPEAAEYKYGKRTEAEEQVKLATFGKLLAITRQAIINDDLSALQDVPRAHGEAAARKVGDLPYAVLSANAKMGDGVDLFHDTHANKAANAAVAVASLAEGIKLMKLQKDLQGKRRLNIQPRYFLGPVAMEGAGEQFFRTGEIGGAANQPGLINPYAGSYFTRVYDPRIDDIAATVWFLAGPKGKTVTVFFLNGIQTPYLEMRQGWSVDGVEYKVRIDAAAKAVDWRALFRNDAASG